MFTKVENQTRKKKPNVRDLIDWIKSKDRGTTQPTEKKTSCVCVCVCVSVCLKESHTHIKRKGWYRRWSRSLTLKTNHPWSVVNDFFFFFSFCCPFVCFFPALNSFFGSRPSLAYLAVVPPTSSLFPYAATSFVSHMCVFPSLSLGCTHTPGCVESVWRGLGIRQEMCLCITFERSWKTGCHRRFCGGY